MLWEAASPSNTISILYFDYFDLAHVSMGQSARITPCLSSIASELEADQIIDPNLDIPCEEWVDSYEDMVAEIMDSTNETPSQTAEDKVRQKVMDAVFGQLRQIREMM